MDMQRHIHYSIHLSTSPKIPFGATSVPAMGWDDALLQDSIRGEPTGMGRRSRTAPGTRGAWVVPGFPAANRGTQVMGRHRATPDTLLRRKAARFYFLFSQTNG